jgi:hypothetical protein
VPRDRLDMVRDTEVFTFDGDQVTRVEVYFGWDLP